MMRLTTDKRRPEALRFYGKLGFAAKHEGMKIHLAVGYHRKSGGRNPRKMGMNCRLLMIVAGLALLLGSLGCKTEPPPDVSGVIPTLTCDNFFVAETFIDGEGPFWMLLDTGAGATGLTPETAARIGRSPAREIKLGELTLTGKVPFIVREMDHLEPAIGLPIDGILGHAVFEPVLLIYDYPAAEVRYRTGSLGDDDPGVAPMAKGNRPMVGAIIAGEHFNVLLDTGANTGIAINEGFGELAFESAPVQTGVHTRMVPSETGIRRAGRLDGQARFGGFRVDRPIIDSSVGSNLLGTAILERFVLTIDQQRGLVQMVLPDGRGLAEPIEMDPEMSIGAAIRPTASGLVIEAVYAGMPAEAAGLRVGDVLVEIDGEPWDGGSCASLQRVRAQGVKVLTIERAGERFEVPLEAVALVP